MKRLSYDKLSTKLIDVVPELRGEYEKERKWWGEEIPGPHIIFGDILTPHLISLLESNREKGRLERIFDFLEELANHEDAHVREVVQVTVCERLGDKKEWLEKARQYMGKATLRLSHEIEKFWGRE